MFLSFRTAFVLWDANHRCFQIDFGVSWDIGIVFQLSRRELVAQPGAATIQRIEGHRFKGKPHFWTR